MRLWLCFSYRSASAVNQRAEPGMTNVELGGWRSSARAPERKRTQGWRLSGAPRPGPAWLRTGGTGTAEGHQRCYSEACRELRCGAAPCPLLVGPGGALLRTPATGSQGAPRGRTPGTPIRTLPQGTKNGFTGSRPQRDPGVEEPKKTAHESAGAAAWRYRVRRGWEG